MCCSIVIPSFNYISTIKGAIEVFDSVRALSVFRECNNNTAQLRLANELITSVILDKISPSVSKICVLSKVMGPMKAVSTAEAAIIVSPIMETILALIYTY